MSNEKIIIKTYNDNKSGCAYTATSDGTIIAMAEFAGPLDWVKEMMYRFYPCHTITMVAGED